MSQNVFVFYVLRLFLSCVGDLHVYYFSFKYGEDGNICDSGESPFGEDSTSLFDLPCPV
jgi:hypothetical protein